MSVCLFFSKLFHQVTGVVGRADVMGCLLILLSFLAFVRYIIFLKFIPLSSGLSFNDLGIPFSRDRIFLQSALRMVTIMTAIHETDFQPLCVA